ncbi:MAG: FAD-binding protein, partial [bacterium]
MRRITTDILVIGAGGAGFRAALSAYENNPNQKITVVSIGTPGHHGVTATACSDRMAFHVSFDFTPPGGDEAIKEHARDIYIGGRRVSDPELAGTLAWESSNAFARLLKLG